jgi:hypothetical protein
LLDDGQTKTQGRENASKNGGKNGYLLARLVQNKRHDHWLFAARFVCDSRGRRDFVGARIGAVMFSVLEIAVMLAALVTGAAIFFPVQDDDRAADDDVLSV